MPFRRLFVSRWSALLWAGGVLWFAYDTASMTAGDSPADANGAAAADYQAIAAAMANAG
jgi:hypothetical protein